jgi:hypothetical protein
VVLHAGETLFMPSGWWHTARSLTTTISVAFDQLGRDNWHDFRREARDKLGYGRVRAGLLSAYLAALGPVLDVAERFGADGDDQWPRSRSMAVATA